MIKRKNKIYKGSVAHGYVLYRSFMYLKCYELDFKEMLRKFCTTKREKQKRRFVKLLEIRHTVSKEIMERGCIILQNVINKKMLEDIKQDKILE